jgi:Lrp/AsnC family transcriptional regulator, regulator for asnA, asnC and gidA
MLNKPKIDETDERILTLLLRESRTTFTEIAKDCGISVGAIRMRYERLKRDGVITGEIMQVNPRLIGYNFVANLRIATTLERENEVLEFLRSKPYIVMSDIGPFWKNNIITFIVLPSMEKIARIQEELESNQNVRGLETMFWVETTGMDHTENLVINPTLKKGKTQQKTPAYPAELNFVDVKIDETDRQIARILTWNARTPFKKIAEQLKVSTKNVIQRYSKLRGTLLTLSTITVDLKKLGYNGVANVFIKVSNKSEIPKIYEQILQIPNVIVVIRVIGTYDLQIYVALTDFEDMFMLTKRFHGVSGIDQADFFVHEPFRDWPLNVFGSLL